jgi:NAD(P)-dependent dehydrogenase (short-subunit alcohol dehydrogenase family)
VGKLEGKIALITGGSSGIGLAAAKRFVDEGAHVFITDRREAELASAAKDIGKNVKALKGEARSSKLEARSHFYADQRRQRQARYRLRQCRDCEICRAWRDYRKDREQ